MTLRTSTLHIGLGNPLYKEFSLLTRQSNDLYNTVNYLMRQVFIPFSKNKRSPTYFRPETLDLIFTLNDEITKYNAERLTRKPVQKGSKNIKKNTTETKEIKPIPLISQQNYILHQGFLQYYVKKLPQYQVLYSQSAQQVIHQVGQAWSGFFSLLALYRTGELKHAPKLPHYHPKNSSNIIKFSNQQLHRQGKCLILASKGNKIRCKIPGNIGEQKIKEVRLIPKNGKFKLEFSYELKENISSIKLNSENQAAIDFGVNNLMAVTTNMGSTPLLITNDLLKSSNQYFNKTKAKEQSRLMDKYKVHNSKKLQALEYKRNKTMDYWLHIASKRIIEFCQQEDIGTLILGKNDGWKQEVSLGKINNQNFVQIPIARLINLLQYKGKASGIEIILQEESYTSKASCLSLDTIPIYGDKVDKTIFSGNRKKKHYHDKKYNMTYSSDINGSYNIGRKNNNHYCPQWATMSGTEQKRLLTPEVVPLHALGQNTITVLTRGLRGVPPLNREQNCN